MNTMRQGKQEKRGRLFIPQNRIRYFFFFIIIGLLAGVSGLVTGDTNETVQINPVVTIVGSTATTDVSQIGNIPIGQIPDERITLTTTVANNENKPISGLRIRSYLVRDGREDTISVQLGSDYRDIELKPGELKIFTKSYSVSKKLRPGPYKVMIRVDSNVTASQSQKESVEYISHEIITIGAYAEAQGAVPVYSPNKIDNPGNYMLMRDIQGGSKDSIFKITTSGVTFDGGGHTVSAINTGFTSGVYVDGQSNLHDITIKNFVFEGIDFGVWFYRVSNGNVINCTFNGCTNMGLRFDQSGSNAIKDNIFTNNALGIGLFQSTANTISNNYFKNTFNAIVNEDQRNLWSIEPQPIKNIIGGTTTAGNVWLNPDGSGHSATISDSDNDGMTDIPYMINGDNIDYYPLSIASEPLNAAAIKDVQKEVIPETNTDVISVEEQVPEQKDKPTPTENKDSSPDLAEPMSPGSIFPLQEYADLAVFSIVTPDAACISDEIIINTTIGNIGALEAKSFSLNYFLSQKISITPGDTEIGFHQIESLKPHENLTITERIKVPSNLGMKLYTLGTIIDPANNIYEENRLNNFKVADNQIQIRDC